MSVSTVPTKDELFEKVEPRESQYGLIFAGAALSNMFASAVTNPFDIVKVRQQMKTQVPGVRANAFWSVGVEMVRNEGAASLMGGFTASMMRELVYSGFRLGSYEFFKDGIYSLSGDALAKDGLTLKVLGATVAATLGSAIANPNDLVKVRMQTFHPGGSPYLSTRHAFATVWGEGAHQPSTTSKFEAFRGGLQSLYRGTSATTIRGIVLSTSQICSYDQIKQTFKKNRLMDEGFNLHFTCSMIAGLFCSITSNPVDVVKVRIMNDKERRYKGVVDCVKTIMINEGPLAFWKGFSMCWARLGAHTVLSFVAFERLRVLFGIQPM